MALNVNDLHELQNVLFEVFKVLSLLEAIAVILLVKVWSILKVVGIIKRDKHCHLFNRDRSVTPAVSLAGGDPTPAGTLTETTEASGQ